MQLTARLELRQDLQYASLDVHGEFDQGAAEPLRDAAQHARARVLGAVDGVPEAHDPLPRQDAFADPGVDAVRGADGVEGVQGPAGRAAVQWPGERSDGADEAGGEIGSGGGDDAGGEGGGVEAVVHGGDQVLLDGPYARRVGLGTGHHVEVVGRVRQVVARFHGREPLAQPVQRGEQRGHGGARGERVGPAAAGVDVVQRAASRGGAEQGERGAQPRERAGERAGPGDGGQGVTDVVGQVAQGGGLGGERRALLGVGEGAVAHQVPDILEAAVLGQFDGRVLAVVVEALAPSDVAQRGLGDDDARESAGHVDRLVGRVRRGGRHVRSPSSVFSIDPTVYA